MQFRDRSFTLYVTGDWVCQKVHVFKRGLQMFNKSITYTQEIN